MGIHVQLTDQDIQCAIDFCHQVQVNPRNFGQKDRQIRNEKILYRDMLVGKTGELAFQKFLHEQFGIEAPIDWNIYSKQIGDAQDFLIGGLFRFEVKSIKHGQWFLIEKDILSRRKKDKTLPHYFVLVKVPYDDRQERPLNHATIMGYCSFDTLVDEKRVLKKGSLLPKTNTPTPLEAENFGVHFSELKENWRMLFYSIMDIQNLFKMQLELFKKAEN